MQLQGLLTESLKLKLETQPPSIGGWVFYWKGIMNFYQFYNKLQGKAYDNNVPAPLEIQDYRSQITAGKKFNGVDSIDGEQKSSWELTPLTDDDMATSSREDSLPTRNTTALGAPLDDEGMKRYTGGV